MFVPQIIVSGKAIPRLIVTGDALVYEAASQCGPVWHVVTRLGRSLGSFLTEANAEQERRMLLRRACRGQRLSIVRSCFQIDGFPVGAIVVPDRTTDLTPLHELDEHVPNYIDEHGRTRPGLAG